MIKVGIAGARGYTGRELVRYLLNHPQVEITRLWAHEIKPGGEVFSKICPEFKGLLDVKIKRFSTDEVKKLDVVFLALPHTVSMNYVPRIINKVRLVVDLSADYRLKDPLVYKKWYRVNHRDLKNLKRAVYGLTEINREKIKNAKLIANPGCYPSGIILALYPLMKAGLLRNVDILVDSKSGISGAGRKKDTGLLYAEVAENIKPYKVNAHQHIPEIVQILQLKSR
ncbi:MAG: N-acetyl-gamma-glutamyl-phosphate reductase, partial [Candidatus Omnitrophica bacterium]|nr:N-acetyl-gamma-glutamyl-phosphate reductase [Candidatus Omnitrophota bacterium]